MLASLTATGVVGTATAFYTEINTVVLVAAGALLAFAVGRYAIRLVKQGAH